MKDAKDTKISAGNSQKAEKQQRLADTNKDNAQAKQKLKDTKQTLAINKEFLASLKDLESGNGIQKGYETNLKQFKKILNVVICFKWYQTDTI